VGEILYIYFEEGHVYIIVQEVKKIYMGGEMSEEWLKNKDIGGY
jgi:hypothetical protein